MMPSHIVDVKRRCYLFKRYLDNYECNDLVKTVLDENMDAFQIYGPNALEFAKNELKRCFPQSSFSAYNLAVIKRSMSLLSQVIIHEKYDGSVEMVKNRYGRNFITKEDFKKQWSKSVLEMENAVKCGERKPLILDLNVFRFNNNSFRTYDEMLQEAISRGKDVQDILI